MSEFEKVKKFGLEISIQPKKQKQYNKGDLVGNNGISYLEEAEPRIRKLTNNRLQRIRKAKFKCYCGNEFVSEIAMIAIGRTNSCGCYQKQKTKEYQDKRKSNGL